MTDVIKATAAENDGKDREKKGKDRLGRKTTGTHFRDLSLLVLVLGTLDSTRNTILRKEGTRDD